MVVVFLSTEEVDVRERDQLRYERHKERERERRLARAHPERRCALSWRNRLHYKVASSHYFNMFC